MHAPCRTSPDAQITATPPRRVRPVPAVSRAIAILRLLGRSPEPMGVKAIAQSLASSPARACTSCACWSTRSWSRSTRTKRYSLGVRHARARAQRDREQRLSRRGATCARPSVAASGASRRSASRSTGSSYMVVLALSHSQVPFRPARGRRQPLSRADQRDRATRGGVQRRNRGARSSGASARCAGRIHRRSTRGARTWSSVRKKGIRSTAATTSAA